MVFILGYLITLFQLRSLYK